MDKLIPHSHTSLIQKDFNFIKDTFFSGITTANDKVDLFKKEFQNYIQKEYIELYSSGTSALYEILLALNIKKNDQVLLPSYICESIKKAVLKCGAIPILYDNEKDSWISSYSQISKKVNKNIKAIIVNHIFGIRYNLEEIEKLSSLNIPLIQDCAHFISNNQSDIEVSNLFTASFYSFNATKLLATGEGGAVCTNNDNLFKELCKNKLDNGISDLNASLGLSQLEQYNDFLLKRNDIANYYFENLGDIAIDLKQYSSIYFRFPIFVKDDSKFLNSKKIAFRKGVDKLLHTTLKDYLPNVENIFKKTISIPIYPSLTKIQQKIIIDEVKRLINEN
ncbi:DegT/DnrJ/EryC1/StrS family aminotransferase [Halarcobacter sp.]|uniref:DegT/DnrJ/EryC1/StrS family aminotransferase n=1 Tax=Halarcobacter sp. TaxID=2321133 RepID=UPI003A93EF89